MREGGRMQTLAMLLCVASSARCFSTSPAGSATCLGAGAFSLSDLWLSARHGVPCGRAAPRREGRVGVGGLGEEAQWRVGVGGTSVLAQRGGVGDAGAKLEAVQRRFREDRTPRLCKNLRAGGCYDCSCDAYHGKRYFDAELGLWRTRRMFRQSTARPSHELFGVRAGLGAVGVHGDGGGGQGEVPVEDGFVVKTVQADGSSRGTGSGTGGRQAGTGQGNSGDFGVGSGAAALLEGADAQGGAPSAESRAAANDVARWRSMCERCQRPDKVCICSALPVQPIPIQTRLIILQHPKERKKATYGTVPIVRLCIEGVHVITAVSLCVSQGTRSRKYTHTHTHTCIRKYAGILPLYIPVAPSPRV